MAGELRRVEGQGALQPDQIGRGEANRRRTFAVCLFAHAGLVGLRGQQPQQTGMLLIIRQQVQPDFIIEVMHAQQASIIAQQDGSPLVQVMQTPSSVGSHLQIAIVRL